MSGLRAYDCYPKGYEKWARTFYAPTAGKARYQYWLEVSDPWPDIKLTDIRSRSRGAVPSVGLVDDKVQHVANYRGVPFVRIGMAVEATDSRPPKRGRIVGANCDANFDVLFDDGTGPFNCHPHYLRFFDADGAEVVA